MVFIRTLSAEENRQSAGRLRKKEKIDAQWSGEEFFSLPEKVIREKKLRSFRVEEQLIHRNRQGKAFCGAEEVKMAGLPL